jgi:hypothetical protein
MYNLPALKVKLSLSLSPPLGLFIHFSSFVTPHTHTSVSTQDFVLPRQALRSLCIKFIKTSLKTKSESGAGGSCL